jgi:hypothetical protein
MGPEADSPDTAKKPTARMEICMIHLSIDRPGREFPLKNSDKLVDMIDRFRREV